MTHARAVMLALLVLLCSTRASAREEDTEPVVLERARLLLVESLRVLAGTALETIYDEVVEERSADPASTRPTAIKYWKWTWRGSLDAGDWRLLASRPVRAGFPEMVEDLTARVRDKFVRGQRSIGRTWAARVEAYSSGRVDRTGPTMGRWYPEGSVRLDAMLADASAVAGSIDGSRMELVLLNSTDVRDAWKRGWGLQGAAGFAVEAVHVQGAWLLVRYHGLEAFEDADAAESGSIDQWRLQGPGRLRLGRRRTREWGDWMRVGEAWLPLSYRFRDVDWVQVGSVPEGSLQIGASDDIDARLALRPPREWTELGQWADATGSGSPILMEAGAAVGAPSARPTLIEHAGPDPDDEDGSAGGVLVLSGGLILALLLLFLRKRLGTARSRAGRANPDH